MDSNTLWLIVIIALIGLSIFGFAQTSAAKQKKQDLRKSVDSQEGFNSSHFIVKVPLSQNTPTGLAVDDSSKKLCLIFGANLRVIGYEDLIESEVIVDGASLTKTSRVSQFAGTAIGAVLAGGVGAIIGGLSGSKTTKEKIRGASLKLIINDTNSPVHLIDFIESANTGTTDPKQALDEAKAWHDLLSVIIKQHKKEESVNQRSTADQIDRYAEMHKNGALSDEEFATAKRITLNHN